MEMKEKILEILDDIHPRITGIQNRNKVAAGLIASHFREFIEWLMWNDDEKFTQGYIKDEKGLRSVDENNNEWTLDELYLYWNNEIKKK